jgi:ectoine hydroxylase-related dioxygenase (phytanoyl-CoA dioxygenase family)
MIGEAEVAFYREHGYLVVPDVLSADEVAEARAVTEAFVEGARSVRDHDDVYDLEPSHSPAEPRVRRIKTPHLHHDVYAAIARHPGILAVLQKIVAPAIRFDTSKLNMKAAGFGAPVEWHQDWAFYPHTNDDLAAVGVMLDDCDAENGPLMCISGTHRGPVYDHHANGRFCGAIDPVTSGLDFGTAEPLTGRAGSITIHHCRTVHGSAPNRSGKPRRLLLFQYRAADAWPLVPSLVPDFEAWCAQLLIGENDPLVPRLADVPVRLPLPPAEHQGSIYENQRGRGASYFEDAGKKEPAEVS